jgi:hypothetical protein
MLFYKVCLVSSDQSQKQLGTHVGASRLAPHSALLLIGSVLSSATRDVCSDAMQSAWSFLHLPAALFLSFRATGLCQAE